MASLVMGSFQSKSRIQFPLQLVTEVSASMFLSGLDSTNPISKELFKRYGLNNLWKYVFL